ncbi:TonB-dependent receptor [Novosphingobium sp.]|uniref:TonB-dependent receptor n=1 Tax=Novosphingobium sp. TaxID=1874826 RepID=UPI0031DA6162
MLALLAVLGAAAPAFAADAPNASDAASAAPKSDDKDSGGEILVTARKRSEDILKVPVTITALTSDALNQRGITSLSTLAQNTPGININDNNSGRADRSFQQIVLRGFTPSTTLATTTSMFIDGVAVASPSEILSITDPAQIDVVKGPQSAYYGRNTFAGAINVTTKEPTDQWHGSLLGMVGTRQNYRLQGAIEGPIFGDVLTFRVTGERFAKNGSWTNAADGTKLGNQMSTVATALLVFKPAYNFKMKLFGLRSEDNDGEGAQGHIFAYNVTTPSGTIVQKSQSNCSFQGNTRGVQGQGTAITNAYICGITPALANPISANTNVTPGLAQWLANPTGRVVKPSEGVNGYGLRRISKHAHLTADWTIDEHLTASYLAGYNREVWTDLLDLDGYDSSALVSTAYPRGYFDFPYLVERKTNDWSMEGRLAYKYGRLHGVVGVSYLKAQAVQGGGGVLFSYANPIPGGLADSKTTGIFGGLTYDVTDQLSISAEGRYQIDNLGAYAVAGGQTVASSAYIPAGYYAGGSKLASATYRNFSPRVIANYQFTPDLMVYASWAKGVNPGMINVSVLSQTANIQQAALNAGATLAVSPEKITNYELGMKGKLFDGALRYSTALYYAKWTNQINAISIVAPDPTSATGLSFINTSANSGNVDLYGFEVEGSWKVSPLISLDGAAAINASDIKQFKSTIVSQLTGIYDFSGKEMKNTSKYSSNFGINLGGDLSAASNARWYSRFDWNFKSGQWSNEANIVRTPDRHIFNLRGGVTRNNVTVEAFITNLFNNHTYTSIADNYTIDPSLAHLAYNSALVVGLPELRTFGLQLKIKM